MGTIKRFVSRKLLVAILTPVLLLINSNLANPLDPETIKNIVMVAVAYLLGQAAVDIVEKAKGGK